MIVKWHVHYKLDETNSLVRNVSVIHCPNSLSGLKSELSHHTLALFHHGSNLNHSCLTIVETIP